MKIYTIQDKSSVRHQTQQVRAGGAGAAGEPASNGQGRSHPLAHSAPHHSGPAPTGPGLARAHLPAGPEFKLSRHRWAILFGLCVFGFLNGVVNELNPILSTMVALLDVSLNEYVQLSQIFSYVPSLAALPCAWFVQNYGLRTSIHVCLVLTSIRNGSRALLFSPDTAHWDELKFVYWITGGFSQSIIVAFYYCLPLKVSENWFPKEERSVAWSLMCTMPQLGNVGVDLIIPRIVTSPATVGSLAYLNLVSLAVTLCTLVATITRSLPKYPPSERRMKATSADDQSLCRNLVRLFTNVNLLTHLFVLGLIESCTIVISWLLQDILAASHLSQVFAGQFMASISIVSATFHFAGSLFLGRQAKTSKYLDSTSSRKCKIYIAVQCIAFQLYATALCIKGYPNQQWWLALATAVVHAVIRCWAAPTYNNMSAQLIAGSVSESFTSATATMLTCVLININMLIFVHLRRQHLAPQADYSYSMLYVGSVVMLATFAYMASFRVKRTPAGAAADRRQSAPQLQIGA